MQARVLASMLAVDNSATLASAPPRLRGGEPRSRAARIRRRRGELTITSGNLASDSAPSYAWGAPMPDAVIVAAARTPIGTARKGTLLDVSAFDLAKYVVAE